MSKKITRRLTFSVVTVFLFASFASASKVDHSIQAHATAPTTVYFQPNSQWAGSGQLHHYAAFFWDDDSIVWENLTAVDASTYSVTPAEGYENIIFAAMNNATNDWGNVIYQTEDLKINEAGDDLFALFDHNAVDNKTQGTWYERGASLPSSGGQDSIKNTKYGTFYQLLVYSFADGDGDGIGDFKGIIDHLDYLEKLGIGGLWLSPIQKAESYHGYDIVDYYSVNPDYEVTVDAVKYDLSKLLTECHNHGIKVILDLVLNHCSYNHPWVTEHPDWFTDDPAFIGMKDFNVANENVTAQLQNIGAYWLTHYPLDGYRLDAVKWLFNSGGMGYADDAKNVAWLTNFYNYCTSQAGRDVFMVGENYTFNEGELAYYHKPIDSSFNFNTITKASEAYEYQSATNFVNWLNSFQSQIRAQNANAIMTNFLSNHDAGRFFNNNFAVQKYLFASYLSILSPGNSFVYYGDEMDLRADVVFGSGSGYEDILYRTPMPFATGRTNMKTFLNGCTDPYHPYISDTSVPYLGGTADSNAAKMNSFYSLYAEAIRAKNAAPVLYYGAIKTNNISDTNIGSYVAYKNSEAATVIFNASSSWKKLQFTSDIEILGNASFHGHASVDGDHVLALAPYSAVVINGDKSFSAYSGGGGGGDIPPVEPGETGVDLYLRGSFNSWGALPNYQFVTTPAGSDYTYVLRHVYLTIGQELKVAHSDWDLQTYGYDHRDLTIGDWGYFDHGVENDNIKCGTTGYYDFYFKNEKIYVFCEQYIYLKGDTIGWDSTDIVGTCLSPWKKYVFHDIHLHANEVIQAWVYKTSDTFTLYCNANEISYNEGYPAVRVNDNVKVTNEGYYDIEVLVGSITGGDAASTYNLTGGSSISAVAFAQGFNTAIAEACHLDGTSVQSEVVAAWDGQAAIFLDLSPEVKSTLKAAASDDPNPDLAAFAAKYDSVYSIRGQMWSLDDFADRAADIPTIGAVSNSSSHFDLVPTLLAIIGGVTVLGVVVIASSSKKRNKDR